MNQYTVTLSFYSENICNYVDLSTVAMTFEKAKETFIKQCIENYKEITRSKCCGTNWTGLSRGYHSLKIEKHTTIDEFIEQLKIGLTEKNVRIISIENMDFIRIRQTILYEYDSDDY
jgi:hypothetical protein